MTSKEQISSKRTDFEGIWDRKNTPTKIRETASQYSSILPEVGTTDKRSKMNRKVWGFSSVFVTLLFYLAAQLVVSAPFLADAVNNNIPVEDLLLNPFIILLSSLAGYAVWLAGMLITTYRKGMKDFFKEYWVHFKKQDILWGVLIAAVLYGVVFGATWFVSDVLNVDMSGADNGGIFANQSGIWLFVLAFGIATVLGPLFEELFFRGYALQGVFRSIDRSVLKAEMSENSYYIKFVQIMDRSRNFLAVIITSVIFGFMHFQGWEQFGQWFVVIVTGLLGAVFAVVTLKFRRLGPVIFAHMLYNGSTLALALMLNSGA